MGDLYHKHVYRHLCTASSKVVDSTRFCFTDLLLGIRHIPGEIQLGALAYLIYSSATNPSPGEEGGYIPPLVLAGKSILTIFGLTMAMYGSNMFRTPLPQKLRIQPANLDFEAEIAYTIDQLNRLSDATPLCAKELNHKINESLERVVIQVEGYAVKHTKTVKTSFFARECIRRSTLGLYNPIFHEVVSNSPLSLETIAHEKAHAAGYARETEAQLIGYMAMRESDNPFIQYLAYRQRLDMTLDNYVDTLLPKRPKGTWLNAALSKLSERGLNQRTVEELRQENDYIKAIRNDRSRYRRFKDKISRQIHSLLLFSTKQGGIHKAYVAVPLRYISAYDPPNGFRISGF